MMASLIDAVVEGRACETKGVYNFAAIEHAKCLMVLREITAYENAASEISVCFCECAFILFIT